jgi:hypothetical protein
MINSSILALIFILLVLVLVILLIAHKGKPRMNKKYFEKHWEHIDSNENYTEAIIKADTLLEEALKNAGIKGGTTGEKLNNSTGFLRDINGAWAAHKLRNQLAHESNVNPTAIDCQKALRQYKKALKDLGAL